MDLLSEKILNTFPDVSINKELSRDSGLAAYALPDYVADWLVSKYAHGQTLDRNRVGQFVRRYMPDKIQANIIKKELMEGEECKILGSFKVEPDLKRKTYKLEIPSLEIKDALIDLEVLNSNEPLLTGYVWGSGTLAYDPSNRNVVMIDFKPMQTMEVDLDFYIKHVRIIIWLNGRT
jgi:ATP-dependent Lon protease